MEIQAVPVNMIDGSGQPTRDFINWQNAIRYFLQSAEGYGTTAEYPIDPRLGQLYYDRTLGYEVVCTAVRNGAVPAVWSRVISASGIASGWFGLTDGATITPDCTNGPKQVVTLGGNRALAAPVNIPGDGYELWLLIKQDASGSRTATWDAVYKFFGSGAKTLSTGVNAIDLAACVYNLADAKWYCQLSTNAQ